MISFNKLLISAAMLAFASSAQAVLINFQDMADSKNGFTYGESVWDPLSLNADFGVDIDITAFSTDGSGNTTDAYAYLDRGIAGLGVCRNLTSGGALKLNHKTNSGTNLCDPSSDDNINTLGRAGGETLTFTFNEDILVSKIWFNNNHDPDYGMDGDTVVIGGNNHTFDEGPTTTNQKETRDDVDLGWLFEFTGTAGMFSALDTLDIGYYMGTEFRAEEFYISAIEVTQPVPEPATLALLGLGLLGIGVTRRR